MQLSTPFQAPVWNIANSSKMFPHPRPGSVQLHMILDTSLRMSVHVLNDPMIYTSSPEAQSAYGRFVVDIRPNTSEVHRIRLMVGGNFNQYHGDVATRAADLTTSKCLWNSTISMEGATDMCLVKKRLPGHPNGRF
jgi:hypothetical protein